MTTTRRRPYDRKWATYSQDFRKEFPLCRLCGVMGRVSPAQAVDHIVPHKGDWDMFWDRCNHQSLCYPCHNAKSNMESRRLVADWEPRPGRWVITGKPGSGKTTAAKQMGLPYWDMDEVAKQKGYLPTWPRPKTQVDDLKRLRKDWIDGLQGGSGAVIVTHSEPAFRIAKEMRAALLRCWAPKGGW